MGNSNLEQQSNSSNTHWAWFWMILAVLYSVSPIDIIPDFIPLAGWADDILGLGISGLNLLQVYTTKSNAALSAILKILKWILLLGGILIVLILVLIGFLIYKSVS